MHCKIVATLGPASLDYEVMKAMVQYGVRIFRLNFSHADAAFFVPAMEMIRRLESELELPLTAMADLCGPKVRIGEVEGSPLQVNKGGHVLLGPLEHKESGPVPYISLEIPALLHGLQVGMPVNLSDGMLQFRVSRVLRENVVYELEAQNGGYLTSHKGISFPGKSLSIKALTEKDRKDVREALEIGIDAVALSFVQEASDVAELQELIREQGAWIPVIAKLERQNAVDNLDAILALADGVMVARGDLGLECPLSSLPIIQKRILRACRHAQKPAIVATQMLLSMVTNPIPTRAECTDVANAILDGADCVMLSEETAVGNHPVEAVRYMNDIARDAEAYYLERLGEPYFPKKEKNPGKYLAYAACLLADNAESKALVCHSTTGTTARLVSSRRPARPIYALTTDDRVLRALNFVWGVHPRLVKPQLESHMARATAFVQEFSEVQPGENVVITSGQKTPGQKELSTNQIKIYTK
ncbi:pyruvate kinase [Desulfonatronum thioautotrophicum]|uniref:pyruvate kinase n=1 Tax=Desulfonatronum thioautotrophicum TaxID=617001 RepID=UPI0005EB426C|nr:pyruvate kinase [Desulfonatronum thioautotrophicum]